jgi:hypothetical protein
MVTRSLRSRIVIVFWLLVCGCSETAAPPKHSVGNFVSEAKLSSEDGAQLAAQLTWVKDQHHVLRLDCLPVAAPPADLDGTAVLPVEQWESACLVFEAGSESGQPVGIWQFNPYPAAKPGLPAPSIVVSGASESQELKFPAAPGNMAPGWLYRYVQIPPLSKPGQYTLIVHILPAADPPPAVGAMSTKRAFGPPLEIFHAEVAVQ